MKYLAKTFYIGIALFLCGASCNLFSNQQDLISATSVDKSSRPGRVFLYLDSDNQPHKVSAYCMVPKRFRQAVVILDNQDDGLPANTKVRKKSGGCGLCNIRDLVLDVVAVDGRGRRNKRLRNLIRMEVAGLGKVSLVATKKERKRLRRLMKESYRLGRDSSLQCEFGKEISANSLLVAKIVRVSGRLRLVLSLYSAQGGCLAASVHADYYPDQPQVAVSAAVDDLFSQVI
jgi:hypothetical protein